MSNTKSVPKHPSIYSYPTKQGLRYAAVATVNGRQKWSRGHLTIKAAEDARDDMRHALRTGMMGSAPARLTLGDYLAREWLPSLNVLPRSLRTYRMEIARASAYLGHVRLIDLTGLHVDRFSRHLRDDLHLGPTTCAHNFTRLSSALARAVKWGLIASNPADRANRPPLGSYEPQDLTDEDIRRLFAAADATVYGVLVYLAVATGMREGELFALTWAMVDFASHQLRIPRSKSRAGVRAIALGPRTIERLRVHRMDQMRRFAEAGGDPPPLVFVTLDGTPMTQPNFWGTWNRIRVAAGLPKLRFHDLRHAQATLLARAGIHPAIMQKRLGHSDASLTLEIYSHTNAADQSEAAAKIEAMLAPS